MGKWLKNNISLKKQL